MKNSLSNHQITSLMAYNAERDMNSENHPGHKMVPSLDAFYEFNEPYDFDFTYDLSSATNFIFIFRTLLIFICKTIGDAKNPSVCHRFK